MESLLDATRLFSQYMLMIALYYVIICYPLLRVLRRRKERR